MNRVNQSFWSRPEGVTGIIFSLGVLGLSGWWISNNLSSVVGFQDSPALLIGAVLAVALIIFVSVESRARAVLWYMYKSLMRGITGLFIQIDPIGILKSYIEDLTANLKKMNKQIIKLRGRKHKLKEIILNNQESIKIHLDEASIAKSKNNPSHVILKSRKAGRLKESNVRLEDLYKKMDILYRVLMKMYDNSEVLKEDVKDQIELKDQEFKIIKASHSAMNSAMNIIRGNSDKKEMFKMALENIADDVSNKVGEMEEFMRLSENFMEGIDLQNGIFEEQGLKMLEEWEKRSDSLLLGMDKEKLILEASNEESLDLNKTLLDSEEMQRVNQYERLFD